MIIATGTLNIDENAKLAQQASDDAKSAANSAADEAGKVKTSLDGKITVSSQEPFDDGKTHDEGDIWYVQDSNHITSEMYTYDGSDWVKTKMSQTALSVGQLSALTADLGTIEAGYLNSVTLDSTTINSGTINAQVKIKSAEYDGGTITNGSFSAGSISGSNIYDSNGDFQYWLDGNGLHTEEYGDQSVWILGNEITIGQSSGHGNLSVDLLAGSSSFFYNGISVPNSGSGIYTNALELKNATINSDAGDFWFEGNGMGSGSGVVALNAADFNKRSSLSAKYNIKDYSSEQALADILGTDIKQYNYRHLDNTQITSIGPIIDDVNNLGDKKIGIANSIKTSENNCISISNEVGILFAAVQELAKQNNELSFQMVQVERKIANE